MIAVVPFTGRAGLGGTTGIITISRLEGDELVDVERWTSRDHLAVALGGPVRDRYGSFAGQPRIRGTVAWTVAERRILITRQRGDRAFEEVFA